MNIKDLIYAYIIGDSFGLSRLKNSDIESNKIVDNKNLNITKGNYSSMTTFMLSTMDSISSNDKFNITDILNKMCTSLIVNKYTSDGNFYDLDKTTLEILEIYMKKNNLSYNYNENDLNGYALSRVLPIIIDNYYKEENLDNFVQLISITNTNEEVLIGIFILYKYILNLMNEKDKHKALKIKFPTGFDTKLLKKYKNILKGNIYYNEIEFNKNIYNILKIIFYVILNTKNFNEIIMMLNNIEGNTNIYSSLIFTIGYLLYGNSDIIDMKKCIKNKKEINKCINKFGGIYEKIS